MAKHPAIATTRVSSVRALLEKTRADSRQWKQSGNIRPWFRGQADAGKAPIPSVFREEYDEFTMTSTFRLKSLAYGARIETKRLDQWLFLAQHYGLPTRLLDWTESAVLACFFAIGQWMDSMKSSRFKSQDMAVWMLHPIELNRLSKQPFFPNTWVPGRAQDNFRLAFHTKKELGTLAFEKTTPQKRWLNATLFPLAVQASAVDPRVTVQRSCFTVNGWHEEDFEKMLAPTNVGEKKFFRKYVMRRSLAPKLLAEIDGMGISFSTVYPDLAGLARELKLRFGPKLKAK